LRITENNSKLNLSKTLKIKNSGNIMLKNATIENNLKPKN